METLDQIKDAHRTKGRSSLVKATQGRIDALVNRIGQKLAEIEERKKLRYHKKDVCVGLINITNE